MFKLFILGIVLFFCAFGLIISINEAIHKKYYFIIIAIILLIIIIAIFYSLKKLF